MEIKYQYQIRDIILTIRTEVAIPKKLNDKEKELFLKLKKVSEFNPNNIVDIK